MKTVFTIIERPGFPDFSALYTEFGLQVEAIHSIRKAISALKKTQPDIVVAEFIYGYSNNYSNVHISNLDVFLVSLQKYAPKAKVIVFVRKDEQQYINKLVPTLPFQTLLLPVTAAMMKTALTQAITE